jgi:hypothetical protein
MNVVFDGIAHYSYEPKTSLAPVSQLWGNLKESKQPSIQGKFHTIGTHVVRSLLLISVPVAYRGGWFGGFKPLPKFRSFDKAQPNAQFHGKYIRNCLVFLFHRPN